MRKYAVFQGRARRSEYWYFILFYEIFYILCLIIDNVAGLLVTEDVGVLSTLVSLALLFYAGTTGQNRFGAGPQINQ
ncbi:MAG: DUF805 domain-containing protein [Spirochaetaceae bacterium]|nr:DUF805 domain-containing protein [Spirochaetaceae bacterium]